MSPGASTERSTAVLLLGHGSRDPRAECVVDELVSAVAKATGLTVRAAHLDFTPPTPVAALQTLAADGFTSVRVVPLLFTAGYHLTHDVPSAVAASGVTERMQVSVAPALLAGGRGKNELLLTALADRLFQAGADARVDGLLLASAGSSSTTARVPVGSLAHDLSLRLGIPVVPTFASSAFPSPSQALEALSERGIERPAVALLFVAPGRLTDSVVVACRGLPVADPLGVSPAFVELLVAQASASARMPVRGSPTENWVAEVRFITVARPPDARAETPTA